VRTDEEIRGRVRELVKAELKRRLDAAHEKLPHRCEHNHRHALDSRKETLGEPNERYNRIQDARHLPLSQTMGLCMLGASDPEQWGGNICDDPIDAQRCPYFKPREDDKSIMDEFSASLKEPAWVEAHLPDVAALLWVAGGSVEQRDEPKEPEVSEPEPKEEEETQESEPEQDEAGVRTEQRVIRVTRHLLDGGVKTEDREMNVKVHPYRPKLSWWRRFLIWIAFGGKDR